MLWSMLTYVLLTMTWLQSSSWVMVVGDDANDYGTHTLLWFVGLSLVVAIIRRIWRFSSVCRSLFCLLLLYQGIDVSVLSAIFDRYQISHNKEVSKCSLHAHTVVSKSRVWGARRKGLIRILLDRYAFSISMNISFVWQLASYIPFGYLRLFQKWHTHTFYGPFSMTT